MREIEGINFLPMGPLISSLGPSCVQKTVNFNNRGGLLTGARGYGMKLVILESLGEDRGRGGLYLSRDSGRFRAAVSGFLVRFHGVSRRRSL